MGTEKINMFEFLETTKGEAYTSTCMELHYSKPKGFVGRQVLYIIKFDGLVYGVIGFGSAVKHLPGRKVLGNLKNGLNNTFYHINKVNGKYPLRNFTIKVLLEAEKKLLNILKTNTKIKSTGLNLWLNYLEQVTFIFGQAILNAD